ncbi:MAG: fasciclin domain-containing protein [Gaiellaceae bacterium]
MSRIALTALVALALAVPAASAAPVREEASPTIAGLAAKTPQLSTLLSLVKKAGLADELSGTTALTVFAPSNAAFAKVPKSTLNALAKNPAQLKRVLLYHVVAGKVTAARVVKLSSAKTLAGPSVRIRVTGKTVRIDSAKVTAADVKASNGIVHLIDRVLLPPKA